MSKFSYTFFTASLNDFCVAACLPHSVVNPTIEEIEKRINEMFDSVT
jgi:hypothetical protein